MHPIFARANRLALYLIVWLVLGLLAALALARPDGLTLWQAAVIAVPLSLGYGFVCLSSWYVCRATPLATTSWAGILANVGGATAAASLLWVAVGRAWALVVARLPGFAGVDEALARDVYVLFVLDMLLYLGMAAVHFAIVATEGSVAAEQRALEIQLHAREAELKALRAQIEPHFLFNSLNSISALAASDPGGARRMSVLLGDFLRSSVRLGLREKIPLAEELALVRQYFEIEQVRFGSRLKFDVSIEDGLGACPVPPLLLQPLAENAVGHGIANLLEGGTVGVKAERDRGALAITFENPVDPDRPRRPRTGVGLNNVRRRLATHYGGQAALEFTESGASVRVRVTLPCAGE